MGLAALILAGLGFAATAAPTAVTWNVDPASSYIRLTIPDQTLAVEGVGNVTVRMRDATSTTEWTDAGGRRAAIDGEIVTLYDDGHSIAFVGGAHNLYALETTSLRPDPAQWDPATTNYTGTGTAPAALGGRVRASYVLAFDAAFVAFRDVRLDITNATGAPIGITSGTFPADTTRCGIVTALADVDGLELPLELGQPIPDVLHGSLPPVVELNAAGGAITDLGGLSRQLTYTIHIPQLAMDLSGTVVTGSAAGLVVASATLPPPPPLLTARKAGPDLVLAWSTNAAGFSLECAKVLPAATWSPASPAPVIVDGHYVVTNAMTLDTVFYRLRYP
ncbi:MAG: hypothetical protein JXQ71_01850 [Verrucomicrobia bacterium]|nr:hypothetical protein [Verrucomicrobiota bacterium]